MARIELECDAPQQILALAISILAVVGILAGTSVDFARLVQDVPYFDDPMRITITNARFTREEHTDLDGDTTVNYYVSGQDDDKQPHTFSISRLFAKTACKGSVARSAFSLWDRKPAYLHAETAHKGRYTSDKAILKAFLPLFAAVNRK